MKEQLAYTEQIDLRGIPCPLNFIRLRLLLENIGTKDILQVDMDKGEPEQSILSGLKELGYQYKILDSENNWIRIFVIPANE